ncbi:MAG: DUF547 domain-containing protein [Planctomycetota bacterium]|jgi:hypothetical protein
MTYVQEDAKGNMPGTLPREGRQLAGLGLPFSVPVILIVLLACTAGCTPVKPDQSDIEITAPEPNYTELANIESVGTVPNDIEPPAYVPPEPAPNDIEPNDGEPNDSEPNDIEPNDVDSNDVDSNIPPSQSATSFHNKCIPILTKFVGKKGMVDYNALRRKRYDLGILLREFETLDPNEYESWAKEDKIAFWINAYNLQLMRIIVDEYPIKSYRWLHVLRDWGPKSIKHIDKRIDGIKKQKFIVTREEFTLKIVEERFFRKDFDEPRAFLALYHATLSGPPLRNEPYYGHKLNKQLDDQARKFLSSTRAFKIDEKKSRVYLSYMLKSRWYGKEFEEKYGTAKLFKIQSPATRAVLNCIRKYISRKDRNFLERENYSVKYIDYDWTINDGPVRK